MMNNELRPYESYIDTGMDWVETIPTHWRKISLRGITELSNKRYGLRNDLELLSVYREYGVVRKKSRDDNHNVESLDLSNYKYVNKGYLVLNKMKMWQGSLGVSKYEGIVSPAYIVCKIKGNINLEYLHLLLRSPKYRTIYNRISYGVRVGQWDMRYDDFKKIIFFIPPRSEQDQIVKYLDYQLAKINKFIKAKKRLIAVLKEQKQAIINEAVTKGLNPNVKMKPSGVEWLGDVPEHWEVINLSRVAKVILSGLDKKSYPNQRKVSLCNYVDVYKNDFIDRSVNFMQATASDEEIRKLNLHKGDIVITKDSESWKDIAVPAIVSDELDNVLCAYHLAIIRVDTKKVSSKFIFCSLLSEYLSTQFKLRAKGVTRYGLSYQAVRDAKVVLPPLKEQIEISDNILACFKSIDSTIKVLQNEIALITEYKNSLISDVVTGKVDVRNIIIEELEEDIIKDTELEEELVNEEVLAAEDGDE